MRFGQGALKPMARATALRDQHGVKRGRWRVTGVGQ